jgi:hypothetical protein
VSNFIGFYCFPLRGFHSSTEKAKFVLSFGGFIDDDGVVVVVV